MSIPGGSGKETAAETVIEEEVPTTAKDAVNDAVNDAVKDDDKEDDKEEEEEQGFAGSISSVSAPPLHFQTTFEPLKAAADGNDGEIPTTTTRRKLSDESYFEELSADDDLETSDDATVHLDSTEGGGGGGLGSAGSRGQLSINTDTTTPTYQQPVSGSVRVKSALNMPISPSSGPDSPPSADIKQKRRSSTVGFTTSTDYDVTSHARGGGGGGDSNLVSPSSHSFKSPPADNSSVVSFSDIAREVLSFASEKRNIDFHLLFRSVPQNDRLFEDYTCAYQKDILIQGRMFISKDHVCFHAKIFGWVTNLVIAFSDILSIERKSTAFVIPNAILITTLHAKYSFTSFLVRESTYSALVRLWRASMGEHAEGLPFQTGFPHPVDPPMSPESSDEEDAQSNYPESTVSLPLPREDSRLSTKVKLRNKFRLLRGKRSKSEYARSPSPTRTDAAGETLGVETSYQEYNSDSGLVSPPGKEKKKSSLAIFNEFVSRVSRSPSDSIRAVLEGGGDSIGGTPKLEHQAPTIKKSSKKSLSKHDESEQPQIDDDDTNTSRFLRKLKLKPSKKSASKSDVAVASKKVPKPPVFCNCRDHCKSVVIDRVYPVSISTLAETLFGSGSFLEKVYAARGFVDVSVGSWNKEDGIEKRHIKYSVPLRFPFAPKHTQCIVTHRYSRREANSVFCVRESVRVPHIPAGSSFRSLSSICAMRHGDTSSRLIVAFEVEFLRNSWLRAALEKSAIEGNIKFWLAFENQLRNEAIALAEERSRPMPTSPVRSDPASSIYSDGDPTEGAEPKNELVVDNIDFKTESSGFLGNLLDNARFIYVAVWMAIRAQTFTVIVPFLTILLLYVNLNAIAWIDGIEERLTELMNPVSLEHPKQPEEGPSAPVMPDWWQNQHPPEILSTLSTAEELLGEKVDTEAVGRLGRKIGSEFKELISNFAAVDQEIFELMRDEFHQRLNEEDNGISGDVNYYQHFYGSSESGDQKKNTVDG